VWAMEKDATYDFGEAFARLTCFLEDEVGLATEGQSVRSKLVCRVRLIDGIETFVGEAENVLNEIKAEIDR